MGAWEREERAGSRDTWSPASAYGREGCGDLSKTITTGQADETPGGPASATRRGEEARGARSISLPGIRAESSTTPQGVIGSTTGQLPPIFPDCLEATVCRLPFRVMSFLHGGARGSYRQFCRTVLRPLLGDFIPGHVIIARRCKGQLSPICSDCLEATSWRLHPGSSHFCTAVQGATTVNFSGLS